MINKDYLIFFLTISLILSCVNLFSPAKSTADTPSSSSAAPPVSVASTNDYSSFNPIQSLLNGASFSPPPKPRSKRSTLLPLRQMSAPLSRCPPGNLNESFASPSPQPLIAVMVASSTRAVVTPSIKSLALFHYLLPSLTTSLDCGFRYIFLLGYDEGDVFYDSTKGMNKTLAWFENKVRLPMQKRNILLTIATVKVANHERKPGPVFNALGQEAYNLGADFMYRVNDDSYLQGNWPAFFVQRLMSLPPPYGVIGPSSVQTDDRILTHDFVHRTHLELFKLDYYPHQLSDWWMDDWISHVYGRQRTFITAPAPYSDISVVHYVHKHPRRYHIDYKHEKLLPQLVLDGQRDIFQWMIEHKRPLAELNAYRESCVQYGEKQSDGTPRALLNLALKKDLQPLPEKLAGDGLTPRSIH